MITGGVAIGTGTTDDGHGPRGTTPPREAPIDAKTLADAVLSAALDKKAFDPAMLEVVDAVGYADVFVIVSARNPRQVRAIADSVRQVLKHDHGLLPRGVEGMETGQWVLVDFDDVVLHVFQDGSRGFYDLEGLWADAPRLAVPEVDGGFGDDVDDDDDDDLYDDEAPLFTLPG